MTVSSGFAVVIFFCAALIIVEYFREKRPINVVIVKIDSKTLDLNELEGVIKESLSWKLYGDYHSDHVELSGDEYVQVVNAARYVTQEVIDYLNGDDSEQSR